MSGPLQLSRSRKTDAVFHNFSEEKAFRKIYRTADDLLGEIRSTVSSETNFVICSDHGIRPVEGYQIYINEILRKNGYLKAAEKGETASFGDEKVRLTGGSTDTDKKAMGSTLGQSIVNAAVSALSQVNLTPGDVYSASQRLGIEKMLTRLASSSMLESVDQNVNWRRSVAYCRIGSELGIRINLEGREPHGIVSRSEYDSVRADLIELLSTLRTPDGRSAFDFVKPREKIYEGPYIEHAPDIVFRPRDMDNNVVTSLYGTEFAPINNHSHDSTGVFIGSGPAFVSQSGSRDKLSLTDVAPITLAASGFDIPNQMTGEIPDKMIKNSASRVQYDNVQFNHVKENKGSTDEVEDRLADLGYI